jgi:hypothetical protein
VIGWLCKGISGKGRCRCLRLLLLLLLLLLRIPLGHELLNVLVALLLLLGHSIVSRSHGGGALIRLLVVQLLLE